MVGGVVPDLWIGPLEVAPVDPAELMMICGWREGVAQVDAAELMTDGRTCVGDTTVPLTPSGLCVQTICPSRYYCPKRVKC